MWLRVDSEDRLILEGWQVADDSGGSCSPPFMAEIARSLGERYESA